jgi:hypothetical protein
MLNLERLRVYRFTLTNESQVDRAFMLYKNDSIAPGPFSRDTTVKSTLEAYKICGRLNERGVGRLSLDLWDKIIAAAKSKIDTANANTEGQDDEEEMPDEFL